MYFLAGEFDSVNPEVCSKSECVQPVSILISTSESDDWRLGRRHNREMAAPLYLTVLPHRPELRTQTKHAATVTEACHFKCLHPLLDTAARLCHFSFTSAEAMLMLRAGTVRGSLVSKS